MDKRNQVSVARWLFIIYLFTLFVSTTATVVVELLLMTGFLLNGQLRSRFLAVFRQPVGKMTLAMMAMLTLGMFYGLAEWPERFDAWLSWRRLLILPMVMAVFDDDVWKLRFTLAAIIFSVLAVLLSYGTFLGDLSIYYRYAPGIVVNNYATQGMFFSASAFAALILARTNHALSSWLRRLLIASALILAANIIFIITGRSGYLTLTVLSAIAAWFLSPYRLRYLMPVTVVVIIALLLSLNRGSRERIAVGVEQMRAYAYTEKTESMAERVLMWQNASMIIQERPLLGTGLAGFKDAYHNQVAHLTGWRKTISSDPHNQYMHFAAEHGLLGAAVFLLFIVSFFRQSVTEPSRILGLGILLAWCATSLANGHFSTFFEGRFFMLWCGVQLAQNLGQQRDKTTTD